MLKISVTHNANLVTLRLEGKLAGLWVPELERVWSSLLAALDSAEVSLDLRELNFIDKEGRTLLRQIRAQSGATFIADTPLTRYYAEEASHNFPQRLGRDD
jgi:anti-anti-sigma regulatory factor